MDTSKQTIEEQCAAKGMRMTEQRRVIARVIEGADDHPDVEELYRRASEIDDRISISTVYRTVKLLEDAGIIARHDFGEGRARYEQVTDAEVLDAFTLLSRLEGIIPALEPAHALAWVSRDREALAGKTVLLNLSGRGDKDVDQVMGILG